MNKIVKLEIRISKRGSTLTRSLIGHMPKF
jgi:hypothetical protein